MATGCLTGLVIFFFPYKNPRPPPPIPTNPPGRSTREGLILPVRLRAGPFGSVWLRFGSVSGPFRVSFGVLGGVGVGSGRGASVREKNFTTPVGRTPCRCQTWRIGKITFLRFKSALFRGSLLKPFQWAFGVFVSYRKEFNAPENPFGWLQERAPKKALFDPQDVIYPDFPFSTSASGISKPRVCLRVAFHENDGNHENDENDEDGLDSYKQGADCWVNGNHGNHANHENHRNAVCKPRVPQTTGLEEICDCRGPLRSQPYSPEIAIANRSEFLSQTFPTPAKPLPQPQCARFFPNLLAPYKVKIPKTGQRGCRG